MTTAASDTWEVRGGASPEEVAAVVAVLSARPGVALEEPAPVLSRWSERSSLLRRPLPHGPGAWRAGLTSR
jgi:hypothetical protein